MKPVPKADDGKRKAKAMPKLASKKARGRPKNKPPSPPSSPSSDSESEGREGEEEEHLVTDDFPPECEETTSPSEEKPPKRLADDQAEMDRLREESRKLDSSVQNSEPRGPGRKQKKLKRKLRRLRKLPRRKKMNRRKNSGDKLS